MGVSQRLMATRVFKQLRTGNLRDKRCRQAVVAEMIDSTIRRRYIFHVTRTLVIRSWAGIGNRHSPGACGGSA